MKSVCLVLLGVLLAAPAAGQTTAAADVVSEVGRPLRLVHAISIAPMRSSPSVAPSAATSPRSSRRCLGSAVEPSRRDNWTEPTATREKRTNSAPRPLAPVRSIASLAWRRPWALASKCRHRYEVNEGSAQTPCTFCSDSSRSTRTRRSTSESRRTSTFSASKDSEHPHSIAPNSSDRRRQRSRR